MKSTLRSCQRFKPFLFRMIDGMDGDNFVIEEFRMPLADSHATYGSTHGIYVFRYPNEYASRKVIASCRKHDVGNWTNTMDDDELSTIFEFLIAESRYLREECLRLSITVL